MAAEFTTGRGAGGRGAGGRGGRDGPARDQVIADLAEAQHGAVSRAQLLSAGLSRHQISAALRAGRLHQMHRGIYAVGHLAIGRRGHWQAALLACGDGSALAAGTAAQAWALLTGPTHPIHIATPTGAGRTRHRIRTHRTDLPFSEVTVLDGLRLTTPSRTIADLAASVQGRQLRRLVERAQDLRRFHPPSIRASLANSPKAEGRRALLDLLAMLEPSEDRTRSHLERLFLRLANQVGAPRPEVNAVVGGRRRDFTFRQSRLVVEVDGYAYHSSREAMARDRRRDRELTAQGWRPIRFTYEEVAFEFLRVGEELIALIKA